MRDLQSITTMELIREIRSRQDKGWDEKAETEDQYFERLALEDELTGTLSYRGNSVSWTASKAENYKRALGLAWDEIRNLGIPSDGNTTVAQAIARFCERGRVGAVE